MYVDAAVLVGQTVSGAMGASLSIRASHCSKPSGRSSTRSCQPRFDRSIQRLPLWSLNSNGDLAFKSVQDYVDAQQVLLDQGVLSRIHSSDPAVYDAGFGVNISVLGNVVSDATAGVCFYRQRASTMRGNLLRSSEQNWLGMAGLVLDHSHNTTADNNTVQGWRVGAMIRGVPMTVSHLPSLLLFSHAHPCLPAAITASGARCIVPASVHASLTLL